MVKFGFEGRDRDFLGHLEGFPIPLPLIGDLNLLQRVRLKEQLPRAPRLRRSDIIAAFEAVEQKPKLHRVREARGKGEVRDKRMVLRKAIS